MAKRYGEYASRGEDVPLGQDVLRGRGALPDSRKFRISRILYWVIQWTWGIVQNIAGAVMTVALLVKNPRRRRFAYHGALVVEWETSGGSMAMGMFIFFGHRGRADAAQVLVHEYGHTVQSCILGPTYLFVIGLPSVLWANLPGLQRSRWENDRSYFDFYTEKWANRCGEAVLHAPAPKR